jgi:alkylation response protein AidB-like acyl-CoA dehydrogenase
MAFIFTEDQAQFRDSVSRFLKDKSSTSEVRSLMATDSGFDPKVWQQLSQQLGMTGVHMPEELGGAGFGPVEMAIVCEEMGKNLYCGPYFASAVCAANALRIAGDELQQETLLPEIISGEKLACLAVSEGRGVWTDEVFSTTATFSSTAKKTDDGHLLNGRKRFVVDACIADTLIVVANDDHGIGFFVVDATAQGVSITGLDSMDPTRKLADVQFTDSPAQKLNNSKPEQLRLLVDIASTALANEMVGGAQTLLDSALSYTQLRFQFGRSIASFQAIKHRLADLLLELELAKSAAYQAAQTLAGSALWGANGQIAHMDKVSEHASLAKAAASEVYLHTALECIQMHGGIGFTWENDTHLWFKRAKSSEVFLGTPAEHRERMLTALCAQSTELRNSA